MAMDRVVLEVDDGLRLLQFALEDTDAIFSLIDRNNDHLSQFGEITAKKYPTRNLVYDSIRSPSNPDKLRMGIWAGDTFTGSINLTPDIGRPAAEIGYYLGKEFCGKGYMARSLNRMVKYGFEEMGLSEIYGKMHPDNRASEAVLVKAGFFLDKKTLAVSRYFISRTAPAEGHYL